jgi:hypothetical protein
LEGQEMLLKNRIDDSAHSVILISLLILNGFHVRARANKVPFEYISLVQNTDSQFTNVADIDRDELPDIQAFKGGCQGFISWYAGSDFQQHIVSKGNFNAGRPLATDIDQDGDLDLVVAKKTDYHVYWYENPLPEADARMTAWAEHDVGLTKKTSKGDYIKDYAVADFDDDGVQDIVVCTFGDPAEIFIYFQDGKDRWQKKTHTYFNGHEGLDVGHLDGDGDLDIITNGRWFEMPVRPRVESLVEHVIDVKWHNQKGGWQRNATMIRVADIDGNGRLDVVISHSEMEGYPVSWYSALDPRAKWTEHTIDPNYGWCQTLDIGDVDLDGDLDILAARFTRPGPPHVPLPHDVRIYRNQSSDEGNWTKQIVRKEGGLYFGHLADMDADGDLDIAGPQSYWTGTIEMWRNDVRQKSPD